MLRRGRLRKFGPPGLNPIQADVVNDRIEDTGIGKYQTRKAWLGGLMNNPPNGLGDQGNVYASRIAMNIADMDAEGVKSRADDYFQKRFDAWLIGKPYDMDRGKSLWNKHNEPRELSHMKNPEVRRYINQRAKARDEFTVAISRMRELGSIGLYGRDDLLAKYMYFKYIVSAASVDNDDWMLDYQKIMEGAPATTNPMTHFRQLPTGESGPLPGTYVDREFRTVPPRPADTDPAEGNNMPKLDRQSKAVSRRYSMIPDMGDAPAPMADDPVAARKDLEGNNAEELKRRYQARREDKPPLPKQSTRATVKSMQDMGIMSRLNGEGLGHFINAAAGDPELTLIALDGETQFEGVTEEEAETAYQAVVDEFGRSGATKKQYRALEAIFKQYRGRGKQKAKSPIKSGLRKEPPI